jgi:hypothetical protein
LPAHDPGPQRLRASDLLGARAFDAAGAPIGKIADLVVEDNAIVAANVTRGPWGRLLGYEREAARGPWLLEVAARAVLRRNSRRVPWAELRLEP